MKWKGKARDLDMSANWKLALTISMADLNSCAPSSDEGGIFRITDIVYAMKGILSLQRKFMPGVTPGLACSTVELTLRST